MQNFLDTEQDLIARFVENHPKTFELNEKRCYSRDTICDACRKTRFDEKK